MLHKSISEAHRALEQWDPISKQPMFKSGAVRLRKLLSATETAKFPMNTPITAAEVQTSFVERVQHTKQNAHAAFADSKQEVRKRFMDDWLESTLESIDILVECTENQVEHLSHDLEVQYGMQVLDRIAKRIRDKLRPFDDRAKRDPENKIPTDGDTFGESVSATLRDTLFASSGPASHALSRMGTNKGYKTLVAMQGLHTFVMHVAGYLEAMKPVSQALWEKGFMESIQFCQNELDRMALWCKHQIKVRAPQVLIVPSLFEVED
jgi:ferredoxin-nitrate reductase